MAIAGKLKINNYARLRKDTLRHEISTFDPKGRRQKNRTDLVRYIKEKGLHITVKNASTADELLVQIKDVDATFSRWDIKPMKGKKLYKYVNDTIDETISVDVPDTDESDDSTDDEESDNAAGDLRSNANHDTRAVRSRSNASDSPAVGPPNILPQCTSP